ncbi:MAG TPA: tetratricopeptide repeat protein [Bryobacteraceae bacterium]|nr:tetratricopeptide repeat protein [Bryobacteraceae bacterium]
MRKLLCAAAIAALAFVSTGCNKLKSRDQLNQGVQSFKNAKYTDAVEHFKQAIALDPSNPNGRLYLAVAYMVQYIPGAESPENVKLGQAARDEFMTVLRDNPKDKTAIAYLASLNFQQASASPDLDTKLKKLDEAREWYTKLTQVDPNAKEAWYSLGVIDWLKWYPKWQTARAKLNMKPEDPGPIKDPKVRQELKTQYGALIDDGLANLQKALNIDPQYDDAMAYMNLLIRERADLSDTPQGYKADVQTADNWVQKALEAKRIKAAKAAQTAGQVTAEK